MCLVATVRQCCLQENKSSLLIKLYPVTSLCISWIRGSVKPSVAIETDPCHSCELPRGTVLKGLPTWLRSCSSSGSREQNDDGLPASCLPVHSVCLLNSIMPVIQLHGIFGQEEKEATSQPHLLFQRGKPEPWKQGDLFVFTQFKAISKQPPNYSKEFKMQFNEIKNSMDG